MLARIYFFLAVKVGGSDWVLGLQAEDSSCSYVYIPFAR